MGTYANGVIGVSVKVFEAKNAQAKATEKGGMFQMLGQCAATIEVNGEVLFERLSGMIGVNYKDRDAFNRGEGNFFITYANSYRSEDGRSFDKVVVSEKMTSYLTVETMKSFNEGFTTSQHDEAIASDAEMSSEDYMSLAKSAMAKAAGLKKEVNNTKSSVEAMKAFADLDAELASTIG